MKDINDIMLNPVRMRIIQTLAVGQNMTATEISEKISDIPRTTLYRHIKILLDNDILSVISEQKIRGSLERTLAINTGEIVKHSTLENAAQNAFAFFMQKYAIFQNYFNGENPDPAKDKIFLNNTILMTTDDEFDQFLSELSGLLRKYSFEYSKGRKARDISIISAPEEK
ncbi:MAG: helix-turn-helix domain-containing protein [Firmicutes bacterium]|nr:helix-turn-helix domain-containing protein [Bacillota bacterium]